MITTAMVVSLTAMDKKTIEKLQDRDSTWQKIGAGFLGGATCVGLKRILGEKTLKPFLKALLKGSFFVVGVGGTGLTLWELKGKEELKKFNSILKNDLKEGLLNELRFSVKHVINYYRGEKTEDFDIDTNALKDSNFSQKIAENLFNFVKKPIRALVAETTVNGLRTFKEEHPVYSYFVIGALPPKNEDQKSSVNPMLKPAAIFMLGFTAQGLAGILKHENPGKVLKQMGKCIILGGGLTLGADKALHSKNTKNVIQDFQKLLIKDVSGVIAQNAKENLYPPVSWIIKARPEEKTSTTNDEKNKEQSWPCTIL